MASSRRRSPPPPSDSQYDYLLKIILLGPSGSGKTSLLHHFLHSEPLHLSSQTIGVEFATKIVTIDPASTSSLSSSSPYPYSAPSTPHRRAPNQPRARRIKLQLWDTAGTERFRSVSRSYYRGAAGAVLVYDVSDWRSFSAAGEFLRDARALGSRGLSVVVVGNKTDVADGWHQQQQHRSDAVTPASVSSRGSASSWGGSESGADDDDTLDGRGTTRGRRASRSREVDADVARRWAGEQRIPLCLETSALSGEGVDDVFLRLARTILARIETGDVNPDDPNSGIQYGDAGGWGIDVADGRSVRSGMTVDDAGSLVGYSGQRLRGRSGRAGFTLGSLGDAFGGKQGCC